MDQERAEMRAEIATIRAQFESAQTELRGKEERIQLLSREVQNLEERCGDAEHEAALVQRAQDELALLQGALRDIAHAVIQDAESRDDSGTQPPASHLHLSPTGPPAPRSPKRGALRGPTSPAFAESTISAVQAALHKHQLQVHELNVKLQATREQLLLVRRQCEVSDENGQALEARVAELTSQLDAARALASQLGQEKDMLQKSLEATRNEKNSLERNRQEVSSMKANGRLQKLADSLEDEKLFLQSELDRLGREGELREAALRGEEDRCSRLREELLTAREELSKTYLARDLLEQQKMEVEGVMSQIDKSKGELEMELEAALMEKSDVQQGLLKLEAVCNSLDQDKRRLQDELRKLIEERNSLQCQCTDQQNDLGSLRKELLQAEQTRLDLESEKVSMQEKGKFVEMEKEKVEYELGQVTRERTELSNQLSALARQKEGLNEELQRVRQRLEQASEMNARINRDLEDLVKEKEEKHVMLEGTEKELQRVQEQLAALRSEKEALEAVLFDTQSNLESSDVRVASLEKEQQTLMVAQEQLKGQVARFSRDLETSEKRARETKAAMQSQAGSQEAEFQQTVSNLKKHNEEICKKLVEEKEQIRSSLERRLQVSLQQLSAEKESEAQQLLARIEELQAHMEALAQQHEESLVRAENDKQQALLIAHHDLQALQERLEGVRRELEEEQAALDRLKRDATTRAEQDRGTVNQLREELSKFKSRLEENRLKSDEEKIRLDARIAEARQERDQTQQECEELRVQLHMSEDRIEGVQAQLQETSRKLKELENINEALRKELNDSRRQLADSNCEKDKYGASNKELREHVKRSEGEKREQARALEEAFQKISALEDARTSLDAEKQRLLGQLREMERTNLVSGQQLASLTEEKQRLESMMELDNGLEVSRAELSRLRARAAEEEERWRGREQGLAMRLEDGRARERKLEDQKHNLEVCLADATQQIQELRAKLGGAEGRVRALDGQLATLEGAKKETEQRLSSVGSTLRRIAGIQLDGSVSLPYRLSSPSRRWSPARHHHHRDREDADRSGPEMIDLDPEVVRKGVRSLMQQVAQIERERDDYKTQVAATQKQLNEVQDAQGKGDARLNQVMHNVKALQEEKGNLEAKLAQKQAALTTQTEALQHKAEESLQLRERVTTLELTVQSNTEEKSQSDFILMQEKMERLRMVIGRLDQEKRSLQDELARAESRGTKLELQRLSLEGDLQRLQMMMQEKDVHCQKLHDKTDMQARTVASLEERCSSLKSTIDQLNIALERASSGEGDLKAEIHELRRSLLDHSSTSQSSNEKLKQMQKSLQNSENERRVLAERLEAAQNASAELRRVQSQHTEHSQRLQTELSNCEVQRSALETQLRLASWPEGGQSNRDEEAARQLQTAQRERLEMKAKADALQDKTLIKIFLLHYGDHFSPLVQVRHLERSLERAKSTSRGYESSAVMQSGDNSGALPALEQELREVRLKVRRLETQLAEREAELSRRGAPAGAERSADIERLRSSQQQAERLLEAREQSHRQQIQLLREQLNQEVKRRQLYVLRSSRAGREMQQLRQALGDSLRTVSQDPSLDATLLEHEARKLDSASSMLPDDGGRASRARSTTPLPLPPPK
ncbi:hypothetical protein B566_EDAN004004 [Ephemera danica]|nr:hypothetical protein B566_EDAN004004 [Ephemera danica]